LPPFGWDRGEVLYFHFPSRDPEPEAARAGLAPRASRAEDGRSTGGALLPRGSNNSGGAGPLPGPTSHLVPSGRPNMRPGLFGASRCCVLVLLQLGRPLIYWSKNVRARHFSAARCRPQSPFVRATCCHGTRLVYDGGLCRSRRWRAKRRVLVAVVGDVFLVGRLTGLFQTRVFSGEPRGPSPRIRARSSATHHWWAEMFSSSSSTTEARRSGASLPAPAPDPWGGRDFRARQRSVHKQITGACRSIFPIWLSKSTTRLFFATR